MSVTIDEPRADDVGSPEPPTPVVAVKRRTIDRVLVGIGLLAIAVLATAGGLLTWGNSFSSNYVDDELASQHISFPSAEALTTEGRTDLLGYASQKLDTGTEAQAYAGYINGHLAKIGGGLSYAELGVPESAAKAATQAAVTAQKPQAEIDGLKAKATAISDQRNTLFKGETLRGLLLSAYAWSTVGRIAGIAAIVAFAATALMTILVALGFVHMRRAATES